MEVMKIDTKIECRNGWIRENGVSKRVSMAEKYSYIVGTKINKWSVGRIYRDGRYTYADCTCECGTRKPVIVRNLVSGLSKDCGCGRKQKLSSRGPDLTGMKFGRLTVVEMLGSNKLQKKTYRCICECGGEAVVTAGSLISGHTSSCGCLNSYYNMYIHKYLESRCINHICEYSVKIGGRRFRFDFYLPDYNAFIEYDGQQHYEETRYYKDNAKKNHESLIAIQERDTIKNRYCEDNGIPLLRIPYWESKNINTIINSYLQRLSERGVAS